MKTIFILFISSFHIHLKKHKINNEVYNASLALNSVINIVSKKMGFDIKPKITGGELIYRNNILVGQ